ncbi:UDP-4-amino-4,6-dideoxy-N-acetyl-beta-L-altrosamine transaminase [Candidatus Margulisiibacteriota bacterium]
MNSIPYARQWLDTDDLKAISESLENNHLTQGPKVADFEKAVASYCGSKYAVAVNSGTAALHLACMAAGINNDDEVITSPITFVATSNAVLYCNARPVFADVSPSTINLDPSNIEARVNSKTKAIIPVHFAGHPCDLSAIKKIADKHNLIVIEDAAHALGSEYKGSKIGSGKYSDLTILSFHAIKAITTGEGGMVLTNSEEMYEKMMMLRSHGITKDNSKMRKDLNQSWFYEMQYLGFNYRITDFQCALGISQLEKLDFYIKRRREIVDKYRKAFEPLQEISFLEEKNDVFSAWHIFPILVEDRQSVFNKLRSRGIYVNVHYIPVYYQPYYREKFGYPQGLCPKAENYYEQTLTLPLFPKLTDKEVDYIIEEVKNAIKKEQ